MTAPHLVITSISSPNAVLKACAEGAAKHGYEFIVIGDSKSPQEFHLDGCRFLSLSQQRALTFKFSQLCPERHYTRKNIGYLMSFQAKAPFIVETDDDNLPGASFWNTPAMEVTAPTLWNAGWVNTYRYFSDLNIWPRGLPLDEVLNAPPSLDGIVPAAVRAPIQQGLADDNPDVDAIYRLILPLPVRFDRDGDVALARGSWCPFNSQNTTWWPEAYPLLYLPSHCSFRMTDIWRSFVAQRIAWQNEWVILFRRPSVTQDRNEHDLMRDFQDEVPGYLNNRRICKILDSVELQGGRGAILSDLSRCYTVLVSEGIFPESEMALLNAWMSDCEELL